jgi:hypothetical protein
MQPDLNQPSTPPTAPVPPPVPPTPPVAPNPEPAPAPSPFGPTAPIAPVPSPKSKKPLIIVLVIVGLLLIAGAVAAYFLLNPGGTSSTVDSNAAQNASSTPAGEKQAITATSGSQLKELCNNKKVSNAVAPNKPYIIAPYVSNGDIWAIFPITGNDESFSLNLAEANVVACLLPDESTATAAQTCQVSNFETKEAFDIQYAGISYTVNFYAAQTGEVLSDSTIVAKGATCPVYSEAKGTVYALPTNVEATPVFESFISENA